MVSQRNSDLIHSHNVNYKNLSADSLKHYSTDALYDRVQTETRHSSMTYGAINIQVVVKRGNKHVNILWAKTTTGV